jgi:uncharacterized protein YegP (UPF0339 family)
MATALRVVGPIEPTTASDPSRLSLEFSIFQDDGGSHRWRLISSDGSVLARSSSFASQADAERGAQHVIDNAHSARLVPAWDEGRPMAFTHPGTIDSEEGLA